MSHSLIPTMTRHLSPSFLFASILTLGLLAACSKQEAANAPAGAAAPAAAAGANLTVVNGQAVPKNRVEQLMEQVKRSGQPVTPELEQRVRDEVVLREIYMQEAQAKGIQGTPEFTTAMEQARQRVMIGELFNNYQKNNPVKDEDLKAEYERVKAQNAGKEYRARHILVPTEDQAKSLTAQIKKGGNFEELAKKFSKDPGSGKNGGNLDWASAGNYVPEFSAAMTKLEKGQMTETPVKSQFGWHIIRVDDIRETNFPPFDQVRPQIEQQLKEKKLVAYREELKAKAKTDYHFDQVASAPAHAGSAPSRQTATVPAPAASVAAPASK